MSNEDGNADVDGNGNEDGNIIHVVIQVDDAHQYGEDGLDD